MIHKGHDRLPFRLCPFSYAQWLKCKLLNRKM
uniref:Uncharacterized protein n=1 Tax=Myoviridae sp. ctBbR2 TaxID=2827667 RepID=A0A8S5SFV1_9CAUD|nr:MAG TPA: hypothetical protein [Myoviridae sp. ctBbR2]DAJ07479.1 MAG TPA: hypothetical protein [Caudoviricetes sp.]